MSPLCKLLYTHSVIGFKDKYSRDKAKYHCENLKGHVSKGKISLTYISLYSKSELFFYHKQMVLDKLLTVLFALVIN